MRYSLPVSVVSLTLFTALLTLLPIDRPLPLVSSVVWAQTVEGRRAEGDQLLEQGIQQFQTSQFQAALQFFEQALVIYREIGDRQGEGIALGNLGNAYTALGQYPQAIDYLEQVLAIFRGIGDRNGEGTALGNLGNAYAALGQYQQAIDFYQQHLAFAREIGDRNGEGNVLSNLGNAYAALGQYQQAIDYHQQGLAIAREIGNRNGEGAILSNLGNAYRNLGQYQQAIDYHQQSLAIVREIGDRQGEGIALGSLGNTYTVLGQYQQAIDFYQQSLAIAREIGDRRGKGAALGNLGNAYSALRQYPQALDYSQQALAITQEIGDRSSEGVVLSNIGALLTRQNQPELAIVFYKQSVNVRESIRGDIRQLSTELQQSFTDTVAGSYRRLADLLLQQDRVLEAQQVLDLLKVQELDDYLQDVRGTVETRDGIEFLQQEKAILERYSAIQANAIGLGQELAQLQAKKSQGGQLTVAEEQRRTQLVQLQQDLNQAFNDFARSPEIQTLISQLSFEAQAQTIRLGALDRLRNNLTDLNAALFYPLILDDRIELIITTPNSPPLRRTVTGVGRAQLNQAIVAFRQALNDPNSNATIPAQQLYRWLIEPIAADLTEANVDTIIYAPDGQLRYVPLAALHDGNQWLIERYRINNITAASLEELTAQPPTQPRVLAAAFADQRIVYPIAIGERTINFAGLPFAGREVSQLATILPNINTLIDLAFSLNRVQPELNQFNILHFATHAAVVPGDASQSFILFGNGDRPTLRDIESWTLNNVDLVVLSACETGLGGFDNNGEQILGLGYQFQNRGAKAVIASLWQVSDGGTQVLMNAFYANLEAGKTKAAALQLAQQALIKGDFIASGVDRGAEISVVSTRTGLPVTVTDRLDHPYYWAPFILIGNGL